MPKVDTRNSGPPGVAPARHTRRRLWIMLSAALAVVFCFMVLGKVLFLLPLPSPANGCVVDARTGAPIAGASLEYHWQVYDYPMIDGAGSQTVNAAVVTDANGLFTLTRPPVRRGLYNTETLPPIVRAEGYVPFTDWGKFERYENGLAIIPMEPADASRR